MSDIQDTSALRPEETASVENSPVDSMAVLPEKQPNNPIHSLNEIEESLDGQSYLLGEVPQSYLLDPKAFLPLNSDRMIGSTNVFESLISSTNVILQTEVAKIQSFQKKIHMWEDEIEKNKASIAAHEGKIKQNNIDMVYDKKNREYWLSRAEQVAVDYSYAEVAKRSDDWSWLVKKYGLKNIDGSAIHIEHDSVLELCKRASNLLITDYRNAGNKYEQTRHDREQENHRIVHEISRFKNTNDILTSYISATYTKEIEPLQEGVILMKELGAKLQFFSQNSQTTFGDLRAWAEPFLDEFIKSNCRVPQSIVTEFRNLASIPLPAQNS